MCWLVPNRLTSEAQQQQMRQLKGTGTAELKGTDAVQPACWRVPLGTAQASPLLAAPPAAAPSLLLLGRGLALRHGKHCGPLQLRPFPFPACRCFYGLAGLQENHEVTNLQAWVVGSV